VARHLGYVRDSAVVHTKGGDLKITFVHDITGRKLAEEALAESEEKFRLLAENAQDIIYRFRLLPVPCFEYVSPSVTRITGYTPEEHYADPELALKMVHPDDRHLLKEMNLSPESARPRQFYMRWLRKDGRILWTEQHNKLTYNAEGKVASIMGIARDVTDRKESEEKIEILNTELAARASELEALNTELEAFNYSVSHDLRAPLSNISGSCEVLLMDVYAEALDDQGKYFVRSIHGQTKRMNHLIDAMLNFSRVNRQELCRVEVDLSNMALAISVELKMKQPDRRVSFTIAEGAKCYGDPVLLRTVLHNLIGNAWKYTGKQESAEIEFGMTNAEGKTVFYVRDNGAGFDAAQVHKLFRPFHRLHASSEFEGFGVGLATVQRIIHRHGGQIAAEGEVGKGATFSFTLQAGKTVPAQATETMRVRAIHLNP